MNQTEIKNLDTTQLLSSLKDLKEVLSHINHFTAEQNNYFTDKNQKIDVRMKINNKQSEEYLQLKANPKSKENAQEVLLDVLGEHVQIQYLKFVILQEFVEDIYARFDRLGSSINKSISPMIDYLESIQDVQDPQ